MTHGYSGGARMASRALQGARHLGLLSSTRQRADCRLVRLGSGYGGWWVPSSCLVPGMVAYCVGAGEDITFDLSLWEMGLRIRTLDPTPRAIQHVERHAPAGADGRFVFLPLAVWDKAERLRFYAPRNPHHVSHSVMNLQQTDKFFEADGRPLADITTEIGDAHVDLLKLDIEGAEHRVIADVMSRGPLPDVLCVEFDQPSTLRLIRQSIALLKENAYQLEKIEGWNCTFHRHDRRRTG